MGTLADIQVTDNVTDALAAQYNLLLGSILRGDTVNAVTMGGTVSLVDSGYPIQRMNCNGANRIVKLPVFAAANHPYFILNVTAATYTLDVQTSAGVSLLTTLLPAVSGWAYLIPDGSVGWKLINTQAGGGGGTWGSITGTLSDQTDLKYFTNAPDGTMLNGKIAPTVTSNNLTLTLQTLAGNNPSAGEPVWIKINGTWRSVTAALSVTKNAGTNWCNAGSAELATREVDYFAYLGYNATDGVVIGFSRIPFGYLYSNFSATTTNEKYCAISTVTHAAAGDDYVNIGRFAATLSAGGGYTWTVPTFTTANLIQRPSNETRWLIYTPATSGITIGNGVWTNSSYQLVGSNMTVNIQFTLGSSSAITGGVTLSTPFASTATLLVLDLIQDAGTQTYRGFAQIAGSTINMWIDNVAGTYANVAYLSSTVPMTWTTNDYMAVFGTYPIA